MDKKNLKKGAWAAGGVALLAVASALCVKGMKAVDKRLKARKEADAVEAAEAELFEDAAETESVEEVVESAVEAAEEIVEADVEAAEKFAEEESVQPNE